MHFHSIPVAIYIPTQPNAHFLVENLFNRLIHLYMCVFQFSSEKGWQCTGTLEGWYMRISTPKITCRSQTFIEPVLFQRRISVVVRVLDDQQIGSGFESRHWLPPTYGNFNHFIIELIYSGVLVYIVFNMQCVCSEFESRHRTLNSRKFLNLKQVDNHCNIKISVL